MMNVSDRRLGYTTYLESWKKDENLKVVEKMAAEGLINKNTVVNIAFASYHWDVNNPTHIPGLEMQESTLKKIVELVHKKQGKVGLSIGGANSQYSLQNSQHYQHTKRIAKCVNETIKKYKFDVIDFDVEDPKDKVLETFSDQQASVINKLRRLNPHVCISLTLMGQSLKDDKSYPLKLLNRTYSNIDNVAIMEYNIWAESPDKFEEQIKKDINFILESGFVLPNKLTLGLMPGKDDWQKNDLTLTRAASLSKWAVDHNLKGVLTWSANRDHTGMNGHPAFAYTKKMQQVTKNLKKDDSAQKGRKNPPLFSKEGLLKEESLTKLGLSEQIRKEFGYDYAKLRKSTSKLPHSIIASKKSDGSYDAFVHVNSKKHGSYPGLLGKGWFANTEIAQNLRTREWVAVKCYKHPDRPISADLLKKEIEILKIQGLYRGFAQYKNKKGTTKTNVYMKYIEGKDLAQIESLPKTMAERIDCAISAIKCLEGLHKKNWIHADIHRGNVMLNKKERKMELIDFNKASPLNAHKEALVVQGGLEIAIPGNVYHNLRHGMMVLNKHTDCFALGETLAYMFNEKVHPKKNGKGYFDKMLLNDHSPLCKDAQWQKLNDILLSLTRPKKVKLQSVVEELKNLKAAL